MNKAYIDFGSCVRFILVRDETLIQYTSFDYTNDTLSSLFAMMKDKKIEHLKFCIPSYYASSLFTGSVALSHEKLATTQGYFCVSLEDLKKLQHLGSALHVDNVSFTERRFGCHNDGIYLFEFENLYQILVVCDGRLVEHEIQTETMVEQTIKGLCMKYKCKDIYNYANGSNLEVLIGTFDNIFSVSDERVLADLTYMEFMMHADDYHAEQYFNSKYVNQYIVADDEEDFGGLEDNSELSEMLSEDEVASKESRKQPQRKREQGNEFDNPRVYRSKFKYALAATLTLMLLINGAAYYLRSNQKTAYGLLYESFTKKSSELQELESRLALLTSQSTVEAGSSVYQFLKKTGLIKKECPVKLQRFYVEGSTIEVTVLSKDADTFVEFYNGLSTDYNVSNVNEEDTTESGIIYTINVVQ